MAINLVQTVSSFLTPDVVARFANAIGVNPALAQTLVNAALPTILASLGGAASSPAGAQRLSDQIGAQDPGLLDNLAATLSGGSHASLASGGASLLSSLLGGAGVTSVAGALSRLTGAQAGQAQSALGLLTPVALGAIGRQDPSSWSSGQALSSLFAGQRDVIQQAMPAGLGAALAGLGLPALGNFAAPASGVRDVAAAADSAAHAAAAKVQSAAQGAAARVETAARDTADAARATTARAERAVEEAAAAGAPGWLWPAVAVVALGALAWWFLGRTPAPAPTPAPKPAVTAPAPTTTAPAQQAAPATPAAPSASLDVAATAANVATASVATLQQTLAGVTDAASAKAAEGKLKDAAAQIDKASGAIAALPEAARKTVAAQAKPAVSKLQEQVTKILGIPGVADILKPILDPVMSKLNAIAGA